MMGRHLVIVLAGLFLAGCGESREEAYERGYEDGVIDTCNQIALLSLDLEHMLKQRRIC
jgi:hypothetical protein